jgi:SAM-dependent methyltransferase
MVAGDDRFYRWVTSQENYYPEYRWEWKGVVEQVSQLAATRTIAVLDVGCGSGDFLSLINAIPGVEAWGLDATETSIEVARAKGLNVVCADTEQFIKKYPEKKFDLVTSFHCIEHVEDPVSFMRSIKALLIADCGAAWISAPLSPMSFEYGWFDPLNNPPHHMSRWSIVALKKLAQIVDMQVAITSSPAGGTVPRALRALMLSKLGKVGYGGALRAIRVALTNVAEFTREIAIQSRRPKIDGRVAGDTFLAVFKWPDLEIGRAVTFIH